MLRDAGIRIVALAALLCGPTDSLQAQPNDVDPIVAKAMEAMGGKERMTKLGALTWKAQTRVMLPTGTEIVHKELGAIQFPTRYRLEATQNLPNGKSINTVTILDGDRGWVVSESRVVELLKDTVRSFQGEILGRWLAIHPLLLKGEGLTLTPLGEVNVGNQPAVGIRVSRNGRPDLGMFFDKENGLPLKTEERIKEQGQEVLYEYHYSDFRIIDGRRYFKRMTWDKDGKRFAEKEWTEVKFHEKLDESTFAKP